MSGYSSRAEDYLKSVLLLSKGKGYARTSEVARELGVKPPSVTGMLKKLKDKGLLEHESYGGIKLTAKGRRVAEKVREKQETIRAFLNLILVPKGAAKRDSCKLEHQLSPETMRNLELFLKFLEEKGLYHELKTSFQKFRKS